MEGIQNSNKRTIEDSTNELIIKRTKNDDISSEVDKILAILPISEHIANEALERYIASPDRFNLALVWCIDNLNSVEPKKNIDLNENIFYSNTNDGNENQLVASTIEDKRDDKSLHGLNEITNNLVGIFPGIDPNYVYNELLKLFDDPNKAETLCMRLMESNAKYPLLKDRQESEKIISKPNNNLEMSIESFMKMFPNPKNVFVGPDRPQTTYHYINLSLSFLMNDFNMLYANYIRKIFAKMKLNFTLTHEELSNQIKDGLNPQIKLKSKRLKCYPLIAQDQFFSYELFYVKNRLQIDNYDQTKKQELATKIAIARINNLLYTCGCCYEEVLLEEMVECTLGHLYCNTCLKRSVEVGVGEGLFQFNCFNEDCKGLFSYPVIQTVVEPNLFSNLLKISLENELKMADIPDLVSCPFCSFCVIMPDPNDKLFRCLNPECMKETCRLCKEPNHIPLRCNQVEKSLETKMRVFIENYMSEAMLRTCYKCNKRFYKVEGCNKMTCQCGAHMCYLCRQPILNYSHFNNGTCKLETDIDQLHKNELEKAAIEARKKFSSEYPEAATIDLKYDPVNHIDKAEKRTESEENMTFINFPFQFIFMPDNLYDSDSNDEDFENNENEDFDNNEDEYVEDGFVVMDDYKDDSDNELFIADESQDLIEDSSTNEDENINDAEDILDSDSSDGLENDVEDLVNLDENELTFIDDKDVDWDDDGYHNFDMF